MSARRDGHVPGAPTGRAWIAAVVAILAATVALNLAVLRLAKADPSFAVEPDYYRRALRWDDELAQRRRNAALGWRASPALDVASAGGAAGAELRVRLSGADGAPLSGATVRVRAFAVARSAHVLAATLVPHAAGEYVARLPVARGGAWELRVEAARGGARFTSVHRLDVTRAAGAPGERAR